MTPPGTPRCGSCLGSSAELRGALGEERASKALLERSLAEAREEARRLLRQASGSAALK